MTPTEPVHDQLVVQMTFQAGNCFNANTIAKRSCCMTPYCFSAWSSALLALCYDADSLFQYTTTYTHRAGISLQHKDRKSSVKLGVGKYWSLNELGIQSIKRFVTFV